MKRSEAKEGGGLIMVIYGSVLLTYRVSSIMICIGLFVLACPPRLDTDRPFFARWWILWRQQTQRRANINWYFFIKIFLPGAIQIWAWVRRSVTVRLGVSLPCHQINIKCWSPPDISSCHLLTRLAELHHRQWQVSIFIKCQHCLAVNKLSPLTLRL